MAKKSIPGPLERRHLLVKDLPEAQCLRTAESYLEAGRAVEALDFLRKAGASERIAEVRAQAVQEGDAFLLRSAAEAAASEPSREEWAALAAAAAQHGKDSYAAEAQRQADRGED